MSVILYVGGWDRAVTLSDNQHPSVVSSVNYRLWEILLGNQSASAIDVELLLYENSGTTTLIDLNAPTIGFSSTLLIYAILCGYMEIASLLIDNGADVNVSDCAGMTPLMHAVRCELDDSIELLVSRGADPDLENVLERIDDTNSGIELSSKSRARIQTAFDVGKAIWNDRLKKLQFEITKQSKIYPVLAVIISEYCLLR